MEDATKQSARSARRRGKSARQLTAQPSGKHPELVEGRGGATGLSLQLSALQRRLAAAEESIRRGDATLEWIQRRVSNSPDRDTVEAAFAATFASIGAFERPGAAALGIGLEGVIESMASIRQSEPFKPTSPFYDSTVLAAHEEYSVIATNTRTLWYNPTGVSANAILFDLDDPADPKIVATFAPRRNISEAASSAEIIAAAISIEPAGLSATGTVLRGVVEASVAATSTEFLTFDTTSPLLQPQAAEFLRGNAAVVNAPLSDGVQIAVPTLITSSSPGKRPTQATPGATVIRDAIRYSDAVAGVTWGNNVIGASKQWSSIHTGSCTVSATATGKYTGAGADLVFAVRGYFVSTTGLVVEDLLNLRLDGAAINDVFSLSATGDYEICQPGGSHPTRLLYRVELICLTNDTFSATDAQASISAQYNDFSATADNLCVVAAVSDCDTGFHIATLQSCEYLRDIGSEWNSKQLTQDYIPRGHYQEAFAALFATGTLQLVTTGEAEGQPGAFSFKRVMRKVGEGVKKGWKWAKHNLGDEMVDLAMDGFDQVINALPLPRPATFFLEKAARPKLEKLAHKLLTEGEPRKAIAQLRSLDAEEQNRFLREHPDQMRVAMEDPALRADVIAALKPKQPQSFWDRLSPFASSSAFGMNPHAAAFGMPGNARGRPGWP